MRFSRIAAIVFLVAAACGPRHGMKQIERPAWIPEPETVELTRGAVSVKRVSFTDPALEALVDVFVDEVYRVTGMRLQHAVAAGRRADIVLGIDGSLPEEAYWIDAGTQGRVSMNAGSALALARGTTTLLQAIQTDEQGLWVPQMHIRDAPKLSWRGLLVDVARQPHPVEVLEALVVMCRYYKIRYLQIHLTDDQAFTFPSAAYPELVSEHAYTREELEALVQFAEVRGVTLIPELDGPGHSLAMRKAMPELFDSLDDEGHMRDLGVMNLGSDAVYEAMDTLIGEVAEIFTTSPYIHIGADEAWLGRIEQAPETAAALEALDSDDPHDLFLQYIVRVDQSVRKTGKQTIVWESFEGTGSARVAIPSDILVMAFETLYQDPEELLAGGYTIINTSWQPLYVTPWARWDAEEILTWGPYRWNHFLEKAPAFGGLDVQPTPAVLGGQMCSWEMAAFHEVDALRTRLPAFASRAWWPPRAADLAAHEAAQRKADARLMRLLLPARTTWDGLSDPDFVGSGPFRQTWFRKSLRVDVQPVLAGLEIRCTTDGTPPDATSPRCDEEPLTLTETTKLWLRAFDGDTPLGPGWYRRLERHVLSAEITGARHYDVRPWEGLSILNPAATVRLSASAEGTIHYTTDGSEPTTEAPAYEGPFEIDAPARVRARLFNPEGEPVGAGWTHAFRSAP